MSICPFSIPSVLVWPCCRNTVTVNHNRLTQGLFLGRGMSTARVCMYAGTFCFIVSWRHGRWGSRPRVAAPPGTRGPSSCCDKGRETWSIISHPDLSLSWLHQFCLQPIGQNKPYDANQNGGKWISGVCKCLGHSVSFLFAHSPRLPRYMWFCFCLSSLHPFHPLLVSGHDRWLGPHL